MKKILGILSLMTVASSMAFAASSVQVSPKLNVIDVADGVVIDAVDTSLDHGKIVIEAGFTPSGIKSTLITVSGLLNKTATIKLPLNTNLTGAATLATSNTLTGLTGGTDNPDASNHVITSDAPLGDETQTVNNVEFTLNSAITTTLTGAEDTGICTGNVAITAFWN